MKDEERSALARQAARARWATEGRGLEESSNATLVLVALGAALTIFADCSARPSVMRNSRIGQVIVCDGGARAQEAWAQIYADRCAEQLERDGGLG